MSALRLSAETRFLVQVCREREPGDLASLVRLTASVRDWERVAALAARHDISALCLRLFDDAATSALLPPAARSSIRSVAIERAAQVAPIRAALPRILARFEQQGVAVLVFKGPALAAEIYPHPALRPFRDLDLLCREEDWDQAARALALEGFEATSPPAPRDVPFAIWFEQSFCDRAGLVHVELHVDPWKLGPLPRCREELWGGARAIEIDGIRALTLAPEHGLITLALHLQRHGLRQLLWFKDLDLAVRRWADLDWDRVAAIAAAEELARLVWHPLSLVARLLGTAVPPAALEALAPSPPVQWLLAATRAGLEADAPSPARQRTIDLLNRALVGRNRERSLELWRLVRERLL